MVLPYEGEGSSLRIPVVLEGPGGRTDDVWMLYDTGASYTTVDRRTLRRLGVRVPADAPEITVRTAGGERRARLALLDRVWLGGFEVRRVTVSVCEACADDEDGTVGLLGLNVSGRFLVTTDHARRELLLRPRGHDGDATLDISPWLKVSASAVQWSDGRVDVEVRAANRAPWPVAEADVEIRCDRTWTAHLRDLPAGGEAREQVALPVGADCDPYTVALARAAW